MNKKISIIIVNYKTPLLLIDCLKSIREQGSMDNWEIIVVDNNSEDDSHEIILHSFPSVKWVQMGYNSGFARANNAGINAATADVVLLLNSDTIVENNAIERCYNQFIQSNYVACGVQLLNTDRTPQISGNYA